MKIREFHWSAPFEVKHMAYEDWLVWHLVVLMKQK